MMLSHVGIVILVAVAVAIGTFMYMGHSDQLLAYLPLFVILACPLLMCLPMMMRGHGKEDRRPPQDKKG